jgi:hypothetical protein
MKEKHFYDIKAFTEEGKQITNSTNNVVKTIRSRFRCSTAMDESASTSEVVSELCSILSNSLTGKSGNRNCRPYCSQAVDRSKQGIAIHLRRAPPKRSRTTTNFAKVNKRLEAFG